ncbi:wnt and FGF inhibitory regulator domain-containing [Fusarium albosuccineum]|uniref:Wnt and FGF inhibitory regulator domain-containing n=1 Tax=Fusarium albosuccineum TaxID=1237068 RepID=A0A8H4L1H7_9HYPO|nr:wnt and FGF inhibitory regulator domain-containing [Fusarium albosuccineum]
MAPESSTQTDDIRATPPTPPLAVPPPTQPSTSTQTETQGQQQFQQPPQGFQQYPQSYGQPFAPYQQQPAQQWPPQIPERKAWMITKLALHGADIVTCIVGLGLTFSLIKSGVLGLVALGACPLLFLALIWDVAEFITRFVRKWQSGIHPGAHVGLSLFIWLGAAIVGGLELTFAAVADADDFESGYSYDSDCYSSRYDSSYGTTTSSCRNEDSNSSKHGIWTALAVFTSFVWLWHFILFVGACIDTHKRNAILKRPVAMVFNGPPYWGPGAQGFQQMPQYYGPPGQMPAQNIPMQNQPQSQGNGKEVATMQPVAERYA